MAFYGSHLIANLKPVVRDQEKGFAMASDVCLLLSLHYALPIVIADGEVTLSPFWQAMHILSDFLIGVCYVAISATLLALVARTGRRLPFRWLFIAFGAFIVSCGWTHFMHVAVIANPANWGWLGVAQAVTVVASGVTALLLPRYVPIITQLIENAVRAQEHADTVRRQADLLSLAYDAIIVRDPQSRVTFWNDGAARMYGWSREEAIGRSIPSFLRTTFADGITWDDVEAIMLSDGRWEGEIRQSTRDGRRIVVASRKVLQRGEDGAPLAIMEINRDITARTAAEVQLRESEERSRTVLAALDEGVVLQGADGAIIAANASAERILGLREDQMLGSTSADARWQAIHEDGAPFPGETHPATLALTTGEAQRNVIMGTRIADGAIAWLSVNAHPLFKPGETRPHGVVASFRDITERKRAEELLLHTALHDPLTGLANRALFVDRLEHALERQRRNHDYRFAVLFLDLDRFKGVNDAFGHLAGDELLVETGQRLQACVRAVDTVARFGGDEFAVVLDNPQTPHTVERIAARIQAALGAPFHIARQAICLTSSIGIATSASPYSRSEDVLRDADTALYQAKGEGRNRFVLFDAGMHTQAVSQLQLERDLRQALEREEFCVVYQPVVSLATHTPVALEALVRWQHPERGLILPDAFIPLLEETGLITRLDEWVVRQACAQLAAWQGALQNASPLGVSVNLSSRHFHTPDLAARVGAIVAASGIAPGQLRLEITERVMLDQTDLAMRLLAELRSLGVVVQMDDFGMGYSSLIYLHRFPFDALKLDREFLSGESAVSDGIVRAVVALAHELHLGVIAEGIEQAEQAERLMAMGCKYGQGYYFARPMAVDQVLPYLQSHLQVR